MQIIHWFDLCHMFLWIWIIYIIYKKMIRLLKVSSYKGLPYKPFCLRVFRISPYKWKLSLLTTVTIKVCYETPADLYLILIVLYKDLVLQRNLLQWPQLNSCDSIELS